MNKLQKVEALFSGTAKLEDDVIDRMTNNEIKVAAKSRGLWDSEKSWFQIRELLKNFDPTNIKEIPMAKKNTSKKVEKKSKVQKSAGPSKMDLCVEWVKKHPKAERKEMVAAFQSKEIGLTKAGASTYVTLVRAKLAKK